MNFIEHFFSEAFIYALGWTVLHSLWQAMVAALLLGLLSFLLQRQPAAVRYLAGKLALFFVLVLSLITFAELYAEASGRLAGGTETGEGLIITVSGISELPYWHQFLNYFNAHLPLIVLIWLLGAAVFSLRLLGGLVYLQHLKHRGVYSAPAPWNGRMRNLAVQMGLNRQVQLLESTIAQAPMVIGHFKPVILLPVGAINALTPAQAEAILAHELAHIARRDYLLNLLQSFIETLYYFNPSVWWISSFIRTEREHCCDDMAVSVSGDPLVYARSLLRLQELYRPAPQPALSLLNNRRQLLHRVRRLLRQPVPPSFPAERMAAALTLLLLVVLLPLSAAHETETVADGEIEVMLNEAEIIFPLDIMETALPRLATMAPDTLPREETTLEVVKGNGERMKVRIRDRKIQELEIDGREIPAGEYEQYRALVEKYLETVEPPEPPSPPSPPAPPSFRMPAPPAPPAPPAVGVPEPPAPPEPPVLKEIDGRRIRRIETRREDGKINIIIETEEGKQFNIENDLDGVFDFDRDLNLDCDLPLLEFRIAGEEYRTAWKAYEQELRRELKGLQFHMNGLVDSLEWKGPFNEE